MKPQKDFHLLKNRVHVTSGAAVFQSDVVSRQSQIHIRLILPWDERLFVLVKKSLDRRNDMSQAFFTIGKDNEQFESRKMAFFAFTN